ncbi:MAG: hypothetical protein PHN56_05275, partial [Candidatus Nanoarchaeia archaeon]|nr:hypothetical protein [Candidatus Nanoarchaeia archaeon]
YTSTPSFLNDLLKQRKRWYSGYFEDSIKYKHLLFNVKRGVLSALLSFNIFAILSVIGLFFYSIIKFILNSMKNFAFFKAINFTLNFPDFKFFYFLYGINLDLIIFIFITIFSAILVYISIKSSDEKLEIKKNFLLYSIYIFIYSFFLSIFWVSGFFHKFFIRKKGDKWNG